MTKAAFDAFVAEYGDRIFAMNLDNQTTIFFGYDSRNSPNIKDVVTDTRDGIDYLIVPYFLDMGPTNHDCAYKIHYNLERVYWIGVLDEEIDGIDYSTTRPSPNRFK